jgi:hypothetical protein
MNRRAWRRVLVVVLPLALLSTGAWAAKPRQEAKPAAAVEPAMHQNIQDAFNEAGVEIMSPHYSQIRDGNRMAIPDASLPPGYAPPAFRVAPVTIRNAPKRKRVATFSCSRAVPSATMITRYWIPFPWELFTYR